MALTNGMRESLARTLENPPSSLAGTSVREVNKIDGCKLLLTDGSWFLFRPSGTEPLVRCYGEAKTPEMLDMIMLAGRELLQGKTS